MRTLSVGEMGVIVDDVVQANVEDITIVSTSGAAYALADVIALMDAAENFEAQP